MLFVECEQDVRDGSFSALEGSSGVRAMRGKAFVLGLLAVCSIASVAVMLRQQVNPSDLFQLSASELNWASTDPVLAPPAPQNSHDYASLARKAILAAKHDDNIIMRASRHEHDAEAVVRKDEAQLNSLYSGSFNSGDPLGLHTGNLPTLEGLTGATGRYSSFADAAASGVAGDILGSVTDTQLEGLKQELNTLSSKKQSILDSLMLRRQSTAAKAAHDATFADSIRLNRARTTDVARAIRAAMRAAQIAQTRAKEASVIEQNEDAIAKIARERAARLSTYRDAAVSGALQAESDMRQHAQDERDAANSRYHSAMGQYTQQLQKYVAQDMSVLGQLKTAEEAAAPGPRLESGVWEQYPVGSLPDVDPSLFMGDAPFRNSTSLPEFEAVSGATQLSEQLASTPATGDENGDSILRVMKQADTELAVLDKKRAQIDPEKQARLKAVHSKVSAQLQELQALASKEGVDTSSPQWGRTHRRAEHHSWSNRAPAHTSVKLGGFTSFPGATLKSVQKSDGNIEALDDGALIRNAKEPVANIAIPLGAYQDASKAHGAVKAPEPTIIDRSTEAMAVRADGTHNSIDNLSITVKAQAPAPLHMPHVV